MRQVTSERRILRLQFQEIRHPMSVWQRNASRAWRARVGPSVRTDTDIECRHHSHTVTSLDRSRSGLHQLLMRCKRVNVAHDTLLRTLGLSGWHWDVRAAATPTQARVTARVAFSTSPLGIDCGVRQRIYAFDVSVRVTRRCVDAMRAMCVICAS